MESSLHYSEADELRRSLREHSIDEYDSVRSRSDAGDGLSYCNYARDMAELAYDDLKHQQYREEQRIEEEEQQRQHLEYLRRQAEHQQEEAFWESQQGFDQPAS